MKNYFSNLKFFSNSGWLNTWKPYLIFFVVVFAVYGHTLSFGLTNFDDNLLVEKQEIFNSFKNIGTLFSTDAFFSVSRVYYRPILNLTYMIDASISGSKIFFYHLDNILLHFLAVCPIFYFLKKLTNKTYLAFVLSLFFLIHPVLTQAVVWIPGRNDSLLTILIMAAVLCFMRFSSQSRLGSFLAYLIFLFLALLTKEVALFLPLLIIFYFLTIGKKDQLENSNKLLIVFSSAAVVFIYFLMRRLALDGGAPLDLNLVIKNLPVAMAMAFKMSSQVILPAKFAVLNTELDSSSIYSLIVLPILLIVIFFSRQRRNDYVWFGVFWFLFFFLVPFILSDGSAYLSHRMYLPLIGFLIILSEIDWLKNLDWQSKRVWVITTILLILLASMTYRNSLNFKDPLSFWQRAVEDSPHSSLAHSNLGSIYSEQNNLAGALSEFSRSLELNPEQRTTHYNLGVVYLEKNNLAAAKDEFEKELKNNPNFYKAWSDLGIIYYRQGKPEEAVKYWQNSLKINPDDAESAAWLNSLNKN
jgi:hypothetical protein